MSIIRRRGKHKGDIYRLYKDFTPSERILVVGAGPSARILKDPRFPWRDYSVIACNSAILMLEPDVWMCFDMNSWRDSWWGEGGARFNLLGAKQIETAIGHQKYFPHDYYTFEHYHSLDLGHSKLDHGRLYGGGTITACAVQFAAGFEHIKEIHLTGCDFGNMLYHFYDERETFPDLRGQLANSQAQRMNYVLELCRDKGIEVAHYGKTLLRIKELGV